MTHRHVLSVTVRDRPGVLLRIASLFARRGYNIESLSVAQTEKPGLSRTTFVVSGEDATVEQVEKQLQKLIDVITVIDHSGSSFVDRELMLIKVAVRTPDDRVEIRQIAQDFRARIVDVARSALIFEVTGNANKMDAFIAQMRQYGIVELIRTGMVALERTEQARTEQVRTEQVRTEQGGSQEEGERPAGGRVHAA
ncbi:MAG TPA: acetolactate synthase small subunit [Trueperaceae bacterium]|nr:acetolactate synthase small subunit [Trueperaceae bacterium]